MADLPKRRWLRFSLRAVFVAFSVVAVWLGWNVHLVQQRRNLLAALPKQRVAAGFVSEKKRLWPTRETDYFTDDWISRSHPSMLGARYRRYEPTAPFRLSILRQWLGDELKILIAYHPGPSPERMRQVFPEAIVCICDEPLDDTLDW